MREGGELTSPFICLGRAEPHALLSPLLFLFRRASVLPQTRTCSKVFPFDFKSPDLADRLIYSSACLLWGAGSCSEACCSDGLGILHWPLPQARAPLLGPRRWAADQAEETD